MYIIAHIFGKHSKHLISSNDTSKKYTFLIQLDWEISLYTVTTKNACREKKNLVFLLVKIGAFYIAL